MHFVHSTWTLADVLHNFDPFGRHEDFGSIDPNDDRMSSWFSVCSKVCCRHEYI
jgi:hypothetical protein